MDSYNIDSEDIKIDLNRNWLKQLHSYDIEIAKVILKLVDEKDKVIKDKDGKQYKSFKDYFNARQNNFIEDLEEKDKIILKKNLLLSKGIEVFRQRMLLMTNIEELLALKDVCDKEQKILQQKQPDNISINVEEYNFFVNRFNDYLDGAKKVKLPEAIESFKKQQNYDNFQKIMDYYDNEILAQDFEIQEVIEKKPLLFLKEKKLDNGFYINENIRNNLITIEHCVNENIKRVEKMQDAVLTNGLGLLQETSDILEIILGERINIELFCNQALINTINITAVSGHFVILKADKTKIFDPVYNGTDIYNIPNEKKDEVIFDSPQVFNGPCGLLCQIKLLDIIRNNPVDLLVHIAEWAYDKDSPQYDKAKKAIEDNQELIKRFLNFFVRKLELLYIEALKNNFEKQPNIKETLLSIMKNSIETQQKNIDWSDAKKDKQEICKSKTEIKMEENRIKFITDLDVIYSKKLKEFQELNFPNMSNINDDLSNDSKHNAGMQKDNNNILSKNESEDIDSKHKSEEIEIQKYDNEQIHLNKALKNKFDELYKANADKKENYLNKITKIILGKYNKLLQDNGMNINEFGEVLDSKGAKIFDNNEDFFKEQFLKDPEIIQAVEEYLGCQLNLNGNGEIFLQMFFDKDFGFLLDKIKEKCLLDNFKDFTNNQNYENFEKALSFYDDKRIPRQKPNSDIKGNDGLLLFKREIKNILEGNGKYQYSFDLFTEAVAILNTGGIDISDLLKYSGNNSNTEELEFYIRNNANHFAIADKEDEIIFNPSITGWVEKNNIFDKNSIFGSLAINDGLCGFFCQIKVLDMIKEEPYSFLKRDIKDNNETDIKYNENLEKNEETIKKFLNFFVRKLELLYLETIKDYFEKHPKQKKYYGQSEEEEYLVDFIENLNDIYQEKFKAFKELNYDVEQKKENKKNLHHNENIYGNDLSFIKNLYNKDEKLKENDDDIINSAPININEYNNKNWFGDDKIIVKDNNVDDVNKNIDEQNLDNGIPLNIDKNRDGNDNVMNNFLLLNKKAKQEISAMPLNISNIEHNKSAKEPVVDFNRYINNGFMPYDDNMDIVQVCLNNIDNLQAYKNKKYKHNGFKCFFSKTCERENALYHFTNAVDEDNIDQSVKTNLINAFNPGIFECCGY